MQLRALFDFDELSYCIYSVFRSVAKYSKKKIKRFIILFLIAFEQRRVRKLKLKTLRKKIHEFEKIIEQNIFRFVTINLVSFSLNNVFIVFNKRQINWNVKIIVKHVIIKTLTLIDFDVSIRIYVNDKYVKQHKLFIVEFIKFIKLKFVNEFFVKNITHTTKIELLIDDYYKQL